MQVFETKENVIKIILF